MSEQNWKDLVAYRIDEAAEALDTSKLLLEHGRLKASINRSYYAIFNGLRAVCHTRQMDFSKHSAVIGYFRKEFIKTGVFDSEFSDMIGEAFDFRGDADYEQFFYPTYADAESQILNAESILTAIKNYIGENNK
ncbi:MAG: HEPN domain-containing protein [Oscillospiraceae bacterium]|nr:HEPN domain-containing protein [Oscillospiraceae bacterium]